MLWLCSDEQDLCGEISDPSGDQIWCASVRRMLLPVQPHDARMGNGGFESIHAHGQMRRAAFARRRTCGDWASWPRRDLYAVYTTSRQLSPKIRPLIDYVVEGDSA